MPDGGVGNGFSDAFEDEGGDQRGIQRAYAVDDCLCVFESGDNRGVGREADFLAIGVDVPEALDAGGEVVFVCFGEVDVLFAEGGEGAGEVGVFDGVVALGVFVGGWG